MSDCTEEVVNDLPFIVRRRVRWSDCDPAAVVYTGRFTAYLLDAVMLFYRQIDWAPGPEWAPGLKVAPPKVGLPCKHMSLTFHRSLVPDDVVDIHIDVTTVREHSFDLAARAYLADGVLAFEGIFSPVCIQTDARIRIAIPPQLRAALQSHWRTTSTGTSGSV
ncbi:thioesterase family protein [Pseudomonas sp.]|uniref:acyl-CoA thioesterase n=1 Tax=Pseudomonas sp. TaxID=306 RepID=UPI00261C217B|nr:thioesterase family protein [Pseudomonas sp.]